MSSNLPPGVTESMIPGNRPEDVEDEAFWERLYDSPSASDETIALIEENPSLTALLYRARDLGYEKGFGEGKADAQMEQAERAQSHGAEFARYNVAVRRAHLSAVHGYMDHEVLTSFPTLFAAHDEAHRRLGEDVSP